MNGGKSHATEEAGAPDDMLKVLAITDRKYMIRNWAASNQQRNISKHLWKIRKLKLYAAQWGTKQILPACIMFLF